MSMFAPICLKWQNIWKFHTNTLPTRFGRNEFGLKQLQVSCFVRDIVEKSYVQIVLKVQIQFVDIENRVLRREPKEEDGAKHVPRAPVPAERLAQAVPPGPCGARSHCGLCIMKVLRDSSRGVIVAMISALLL